MYVYTNADDERLHLIESYNLVLENHLRLLTLSKVFLVIHVVTRVGNEGAVV